jgi:hypothetical protein
VGGYQGVRKAESQNGSHSHVLGWGEHCDDPRPVRW